MYLSYIEDLEERKKFIDECDSCFITGILKKDNRDSIIYKLCHHAMFFGAYDSGKKIGYSAIYANDIVNNVSFISMLGVLKDFQGKGIGQKLLDISVNCALENGMKKIRLEVNKQNTNAINFYKRNGFNVESEKSNSYFMIKNLMN